MALIRLHEANPIYEWDSVERVLYKYNGDPLYDFDGELLREHAGSPLYIWEAPFFKTLSGEIILRWENMELN